MSGRPDGLFQPLPALTREDISIRELTFWRMLYETAARSAEVLRLDVPDLDMPNRKARVRRKGGAIDVIVWQTGTARLLPRLLKGRCDPLPDGSSCLIAGQRHIRWIFRQGYGDPGWMRPRTTRAGAVCSWSSR